MPLGYHDPAHMQLFYTAETKVRTMQLLVLTDTEGNEVYINPSDVTVVRKITTPTGYPPSAKALLGFSSGQHQAVRETAGAVLFRLQQLEV